MLAELVLELVSVIFAFLIVIGLVCLGWLLVWKFFLAKFKFVKELLSISTTTQQQESTKLSKSETSFDRSDMLNRGGKRRTAK